MNYIQLRKSENRKIIIFHIYIYIITRERGHNLKVNKERYMGNFGRGKGRRKLYNYTVISKV